MMEYLETPKKWEICFFDDSFSFFLQRQLFFLQTRTLIKTLLLFSSRPISFYIVNNDENIFVELVDSLKEFQGNFKFRWNKNVLWMWVRSVIWALLQLCQLLLQIFIQEKKQFRWPSERRNEIMWDAALVQSVSIQLSEMSCCIDDLVVIYSDFCDKVGDIVGATGSRHS